MNSLSKLYQETIMNYNQEEDFASVYTCNKTLIKQLDKICELSSSIIVEMEDDYSKSYILPKEWIKIKKPRELSEEQREKMASRARVNFEKKSEE